MSTRIGELTYRYGARGGVMYSIELRHNGLRKHRLIQGRSEETVQLKTQLQAADWEARWESLEAKKAERREKDAGKREAEERTAEAEAAIDRLSGLLQATLAIDDVVDWSRLLNAAPFVEAPPARRRQSATPKLKLPPEPRRQNAKYSVNRGVLDRIFASRRVRKEAAAEQTFDQDLRAWESAVQELTMRHHDAVQKHERTAHATDVAHKEAYAAWEARKSAYQDKLAMNNAVIESRRRAYTEGDPTAIVEYFDLVLSESDYPEQFPKEFEMEFVESSKTLIVEYQLPNPDDLPRLKEVKFIVSRNEMQEKEMSDGQAKRLYDSVVYQVVLRTIHEVFEADVARVVQAVSFNGMVTTIDRRVGKPATACIVSIRVAREEFLDVDLEHVDPRACFKSLKGIGSSKLHSLAPVAPVMAIQREDARFVDGYGVVDSLDDSVNLASMDWQDFEHLIRELFESEFSSSGGEVRVTQASRDGGVDAIAFDPDPIRGGKIVIQAKRYTGVVGVSAVRDLFGTVHNEGATKGILVTTSDYGSDSYAFANGKPLVLLNGANLLHMLGKHGRRARIDLLEARRLFAEQVKPSGLGGEPLLD